MAVRYTADYQIAHLSNKIFQITFDDVLDENAPNDDIIIGGLQSRTGFIDRRTSEAILCRLMVAEWRIRVFGNANVFRYLTNLEDEQLLITIVDGTHIVFRGFMEPRNYRYKFQDDLPDSIIITAADGFHRLFTQKFTLQDYINFNNPLGLAYGRTGSRVAPSDLLYEGVSKALSYGGNRIYRPIGLSSNITYYNTGTGGQWENPVDVFMNTDIPVSQLIGKTWGQILDDDICVGGNNRLSAYKNEISLKNIPQLAARSHAIYFLESNGLPADPIRRVDTGRLDLNNAEINDTTIVTATDTITEVNVKTYRGYDSLATELSTQNSMVNGDFKLSGREAPGWTIRTNPAASTFGERHPRPFQFLTSGGYQAPQTPSSDIGVMRYTLIYERNEPVRTADNGNKITQWAVGASKPMGAVKYKRDEIGAQLSYYIKTDGPIGLVDGNYDIRNNPVVHDLGIFFTELDESIEPVVQSDGTIELTDEITTGRRWTYDTRARQWSDYIEITDAPRPSDTLGIQNQITTPFGAGAGDSREVIADGITYQLTADVRLTEASINFRAGFVFRDDDSGRRIFDFDRPTTYMTIGFSEALVHENINPGDVYRCFNETKSVVFRVNRVVDEFTEPTGSSVTGTSDYDVELLTGNVDTIAAGETDFTLERVSSETLSNTQPFFTTWTNIRIPIYNIPSYGVIHIQVSNPYVIRNFNVRDFEEMRCYYDNFELLERRPVRGDNTTITRTATRTDIKPRYTYNTPVITHTSNLNEKFTGAMRRIRINNGVQDIRGGPTPAWKVGFYSGEQRVDITDPDGTHTREAIVASQIILQTSGSNELIDVVVDIDSISGLHPNRGIWWNNKNYGIVELLEDYGAGTARITLVEIGG